MVDPLHESMRKLAEALGGTYTPDEDGDGGTLIVSLSITPEAIRAANPQPGDFKRELERLERELYHPDDLAPWRRSLREGIDDAIEREADHGR